MHEDSHNLESQAPSDGVAGSDKPKASILLVEDDESFIETVQSFLELAGFEVQCAPNGAEGLKLIMSRDYDVIICDMMMPHLPGDMFYIAVQRIKPALCKRFIFMSGFKGEKKVDDFIRKVQGVLLWKPFAIGDLMATIDLVLGTGP